MMIVFIENYFAEAMKPGQVYYMFLKTRQKQISWNLQMLGFHG
jgi:hypothetical protein